MYFIFQSVFFYLAKGLSGGLIGIFDKTKSVKKSEKCTNPLMILSTYFQRIKKGRKGTGKY